MLRNFLFGNSEQRNNEEVSEITDDQLRNKFKDVCISSGSMDSADTLLSIGPFKVLSTGPDKKGIVWNCNTGEILYELVGHSRVITASLYMGCFVDDKSSNPIPVIVTASSDETIRIWNLVNDGECLKIVNKHQSTVKCFCLIPSKPMTILSGGQDICVWNQSFNLLFKLERNSLDYVHTTIAISSKRVVCATDHPNLVIYDILEESSPQSTSPLKSYELKQSKKLPGHRKSISHLKIIPESLFVSVSMEGTILIWNAYNLNILRKFNNYEHYENVKDHTFPYKVNDLFIADQRYIIAAIGAGFSIYDVHQDKCVCRKVNAHHSAVSRILLVSDGCCVATSSLDGTIRLWASPLTQGEQEEVTGPQTSLEILFSKSVLNSKNFPLDIELVGVCNGHSNSVKSINKCSVDGLMSCSSDGMFIFWKDSSLIRKHQVKEVSDVLSNIDWLNH